jgi:predicted GNAT family N-acyltransferase
MTELEFTVEQVKWQDKKSHLRHIRTTVFIEEQHVPIDMEWDEYDETCVHVIAETNEEPIGTARLLESGQIGRMAVLKAYRNHGVATKMLEKQLSIAKSLKMNAVFLNSQIDVVEFYKKFGFVEEGGIFDDAGIPHRKMTKALD